MSDIPDRNAAREKLIKEHIQHIGEESFPDDEVKWTVTEMLHKGRYCAAEAIAQPPTVGYEKFRFIIGFVDESEFYVVGCYCWHRNKWSLLFTDPDAKEDWKNIFV